MPAHRRKSRIPDTVKILALAPVALIAIVVAVAYTAWGIALMGAWILTRMLA